MKATDLIAAFMIYKVLISIFPDLSELNRSLMNLFRSKSSPQFIISQIPDRLLREVIKKVGDQKLSTKPVQVTATTLGRFLSSTKYIRDTISPRGFNTYLDGWFKLNTCYPDRVSISSIADGQLMTIKKFVYS